MKVPFLHKVIEELNLPNLVNDKDIKTLLPAAAYSFVPKVVYSYGDCIGKFLFNYNKTLKNLSKQDLLENIPCDCQSNPDIREYIYGHYGHVFTGNLDIISNREVRSIMKKGAKFREMPRTNSKTIQEMLSGILDELCLKWSAKCKLDIVMFQPWLDKVKVVLHKRIMAARNKGSFAISTQILRKEENKKYIEELHRKYVIVPIDKAGSNFAIICKSLYFQILKKELGFKNNTVEGNDVYETTNFNEEDLIKKHKAILKDFGIKLTRTNNYIPNLYWTAKLHKTPYKARFIAGAAKSTLKQLSKELALVLKAVKGRFRNYCYKIKVNTGYTVYWSVENSKEVVEKLKTVKARSIETFDFSTLYTNLPLDHIYENLEELITKMFTSRNQDGTYESERLDYVNVCVGRDKQFWSKKEYKGYKIYDLDKTLEAIKVILFNNYVRCGPYIFHQKKGIPMGDNCSPFLADLYLSWLEFKFMKEIMVSDKKLAKQLSNNSRYLDDISVLNFTNFGFVSRRIYPEELPLENTNESITHDAFLDLYISVENEKFLIIIYNKTDYFSFEIASFSYADSNIHSQIGYNTFYSQLYRFSQLCSTIKNFEERAQMVHSKLIARGYSLEKLNKVYKKFLNKNRENLLNAYGCLPKMIGQ